MSHKRTLLIVGSGLSRYRIDSRLLAFYDTWYLDSDTPEPCSENYDVIQTIGIDTKVEAQKLPSWYSTKRSFNLSPWFGLQQEEEEEEEEKDHHI